MKLDRENIKYISNILKLSNENINLELLTNVFNSIKHNPELEVDILDSFSDNQFKVKSNLVNNLDELNLLNKDTEVVIWGGWYGSILIPLLHDKVKEITIIDQHKPSIQIGHHRILKDYENVNWRTADIFDIYMDMYNTCNLFINTSCEHMRPMNEWGPIGPKSMWKDNKFGIPNKCYSIPWWNRVNKKAHFAFTSNNMYNIEGHINCVDTIEDFKLQLPTGSKVLKEDNLVDERGTRFTLIGKL
jgi:hypothetical protein